MPWMSMRGPMVTFRGRIRGCLATRDYQYQTTMEEPRKNGLMLDNFTLCQTSQTCDLLLTSIK